MSEMTDTLRERRATEADKMSAIIDAARAESRDLRASDARAFQSSVDAIKQFDERIAELELAETRSAAAARSRVLNGATGHQSTGMGYTSGGETYHRGPDSPSYFKDLLYSQRGDADAADRLRRNNREQGLEQRALGNTGGAGGSAGEFAPPAWLVDSFVKLARPGRVTADLFHHEQLPAGVSTVNLPRVSGGTSVTNQTTQNTALSQTDMTTSSLSSSIVTIGGKAVVSQQLLDQSAIPFDQVVLQDLAADYARQLGTQVLSGTGAAGQLRGYLTPASTNVVTWTQAAPTASGFYAQLAKLQGQINATRYMPPDTVVMHPRRWAWFASFTDSTGRPLIVPASGGFNSMANPGDAVSAGQVGSVLGMNVYTDPNIAQNLGAGTNQDIVLMFPSDDVWLWESDVRSDALVQPYGDSLGVLFRYWNYAAMIPDRYLASLGQLTGSGLVTPVFAG